MAMKALIAMSGGVDSSVAATRMLQDGYECIGVNMKLYEDSDIGMERTKSCGSADGAEDARRVCDKLGMSFEVCYFRDDFIDKVMNKFADCYRCGLTPNPCVDCNRNLKFGRLYEYGRQLGCEKIVTGHYARILQNENTKLYELHKGADEKKDQSYFLYMLSQEQLSHILFPIGELCKEETRGIAGQNGFDNAGKKDSQDVCFIPDGDYHRFLKNRGIEGEPGDFVDEEGNVLGRHTGICNYTIGQRKGLGVSGKAPYFVKEINASKNQIVLSDNDSLFSRCLKAKNFDWTVDRLEDFDCLETINYSDDGSVSFTCEAKIRYRHNPAKATVKIDIDGQIEVCFDEAQRAITCGQAVVLYSGSRVLGGGTITEVM